GATMRPIIFSRLSIRRRSIVWSSFSGWDNAREHPYRLTVVVLVVSENRCPLRSIPSTSMGKAMDTRSLLRWAEMGGDKDSISQLCRQDLEKSGAPRSECTLVF